MRKTFVKILEKLAKDNPDIFLLTGDLGKFFDDFKNSYPKRFINAGVAEGNMIGVAAGLALSGKNVYCYSIIPFLAMRAFEQIRVDLCYHNLNVKLLGAGGGLVYGFEGITHQAIEDIAIMRSLPNMTVVAPGDLIEAEAVAKESVNYKGPLYIRFGKDNSPPVHSSAPNLKIGEGIVLNKGNNISIIATGSTLYTAKVVSDELIRNGLGTTLISMHTIKPLDKELIRDCAKNNKAIFTIEEHSEIGGLGSAVSEYLMELDYQGLFRKIALPDNFSSEVGDHDHLCKKCGLDSKIITNYILKEHKK